MAENSCVQEAPDLIGFLGLGQMGGRMVPNLVAHGRAVLAYDPAAERLDACVRKGAVAAGSAAEVVRRASVVLTSLRSSAAFVEVAETTLLPNCREGHVFGDLGTTEGREVRRLGKLFETRGAALVDCPVSGAPGPTMRVFMGGDRAVCERLRPVLEGTADPNRIVYCGPSGTGQAVKMVNQLGMGLVTAAYLEAVAAGVLCGADLEAIQQGVGGDEGWRRTLREVARRAAEGTAHELYVKHPELPYFVGEAAEQGFDLPLTKALLDFLEEGPCDLVDNMARPRTSFWSQLLRAAEGGDEKKGVS